MKRIILGKQFNVGSWWGKIVLAASQIGIVIALTTMFLAGIGAFDTVREWTLAALNWDLQLWQFGGIVLGLIILMLAAAWTLGMVSYMREWSKQFWTHDNPMRKEMAEMEKRLTEKIEEARKR